MTNIEEGNKLIAEFMQLSVSKTYGELCYADWDGMHSVKYHSSWDWLMPVVEKIEEIELPKSANPQEGTIWPNFLIEKKWVTICIGTERTGSEKVIDSKIDATWKMVIQFIQWYNNQKPIV